MTKRILIWISTFWAVLVFFTLMILLLPCILLPFLGGTRFTYISYHFLWLWAKLFSLCTGIRYQLIGRENIPQHTALIFVSNHTSFLDVPGLRLLIPGEFRPLAKKELLKIPLFGFIVKAATVVVDRSDPESRRKSKEQALSLVKKGISILIFAEGTQNRTSSPLQPFKDGAFKIAIETQTPVLPVVVKGAARLMPPGKLRIAPGRIQVVAGQPISTCGLTEKEVPRLKQQTFDAMLRMLNEEVQGG
jgi:1-acyl-sn-glycerol-3-phosphate acyltransferase